MYLFQKAIIDIYAEEDAKIFAEIYKTTQKEKSNMSQSIMNSQISKLNSLSIAHKNILEVSTSIRQNISTVTQTNSISVKKGVCSRVKVITFPKNEKVGAVNEWVEGETVALNLYSLELVDQQLNAILWDLTEKPSSELYRLCAVYQLDRCSNEWSGCIYIEQL